MKTRISRFIPIFVIAGFWVVLPTMASDGSTGATGSGSQANQSISSQNIKANQTVPSTDNNQQNQTIPGQNNNQFNRTIPPQNNYQITNGQMSIGPSNQGLGYSNNFEISSNVSEGLGQSNRNLGSTYSSGNTNSPGLGPGTGSGSGSNTNWADYTNANGTTTYNTNIPRWWEKR